MIDCLCRIEDIIAMVNDEMTVPPPSSPSKVLRQTSERLVTNCIYVESKLQMTSLKLKYNFITEKPFTVQVDQIDPCFFSHLERFGDCIFCTKTPEILGYNIFDNNVLFTIFDVAIVRRCVPHFEVSCGFALKNNFRCIDSKSGKFYLRVQCKFSEQAPEKTWNNRSR